MTDIVDVSRIRALNDALRRSLAGGVLMMTAGVIALGRTKQIAILDAIAAFDGFDADNDPHGERDFGALQVEGEHLFFKIAYFDRSLTSHSPRSNSPPFASGSDLQERSSRSASKRRAGVPCHRMESDGSLRAADGTGMAGVPYARGSTCDSDPSSSEADGCST